MKIGIDLHGVIDSDPDLFKSLFTLMSLQNREVYIVSGPPRADIIAELDKLGFEEKSHYTDVYSVVDFLKESGVKMWQDKNRRWWCNDKDWCESKAKICDKLSLEYMLDDKEMYRKAFDDIETKFVLYVYEE
jgi:hypothetical protein